MPVWIEDCPQKRIPLSRAAIQTKDLNLFKRVKEKVMKRKKCLMQVLADLINLKIKFNCRC
jgi:hypothetical protein